MNSIISFTAINYFTSEFLSMLMDTSIKMGFIIILILLIFNFRKRLSSELKHLLLFSSIGSAIALPLISRLIHGINFSILNTNLGNGSNPTQSQLISNNINNYSSLKVLNIKPLNIAYLATNSKFNWTGYLFLLWSLISVFLLFRLAIGLYGARRILRYSEKITHPTFSVLKKDLKEEIGLKRDVELFISKDIFSPFTFGTVKPVIILPDDTANWNEERLRVVLIHELIHIKRLDNLTQIVAQIICVVHWFNPILWFACKMLKVEQENSCDDYVLRYGVKPSNYAEHLLQIMKTYDSTKSYFNSFSITYISNIEKRIKNILGGSKSYEALSFKSVSKYIILISFILVSLSFINITTAENQRISTSNIAFDEERLFIKNSIYLNKGDNMVVSERLNQDKFQVVVKMTEPMNVAYIKFKGVQNIPVNTWRLQSWINDQGFTIISHPKCIFYGNFMKVPVEQADFEIQWPIAETPKNVTGEIGFKIVEPIKVLSTYHQGSSELLPQTYEFLSTILKENGYKKVTSESHREIYMSDPRTVSVEKQISELQIAIE
ncbi:M56 family metallopeptidase [Wukongibacter sp. M2B1]|uniref:M56 family metallopeptidase n=1 Tax=Wukongibacter sp. M2B1 TaxID=3088895 RepID=UPI003D79B956